MIHAKEKSDFGIPFAKMNYNSISDQLWFRFHDIRHHLTIVFDAALSSNDSSYQKIERKFACLVDRHENTGNAIRNTHQQRERNIKKRVMIIPFIKLISWLPTSCTILSICINAKPSKPLIITIFYLLMPVSMFLSSILVFHFKRPVSRNQSKSRYISKRQSH